MLLLRALLLPPVTVARLDSNLITTARLNLIIRQYLRRPILLNNNLFFDHAPLSRSTSSLAVVCQGNNSSHLSNSCTVRRCSKSTPDQIIRRINTRTIQDCNRLLPRTRHTLVATIVPPPWSRSSISTKKRTEMADNNNSSSNKNNTLLGRPIWLCSLCRPCSNQYSKSSTHLISVSNGSNPTINSTWCRTTTFWRR